MKRGKYFAIVGFSSLFFLAGCSQTNEPLSEIPEVNFWTVGSGGGSVRFGKDFVSIFKEIDKDKASLSAFLMAIAEQPQNEKDIARTTSLPPSKIEELISECRSINWIREEQGRWATTVPVITDRQAVLIKKRLTTLALSLAEKVKDNVQEIESSYEKEKAASDPSWSEVAHLVIDKLLVDGTFHGAIEDLEQEKTAQEFYTPDQKILPAFLLEQGEHAANFGCNWYRFEHDGALREIYVLHGTLLGRTEISMNRYRNDPFFSSFIFKVPPTGETGDLSQPELEVLRGLGWLDGERLAIPIVQADSIKAFLPLIQRTGKEMAEIVFADYSVFLESFKSSPYAAFVDGAGDYIQACYHILFSMIIEKLVEERIVPFIPRPVPDSFCVYMTLGSVWD
jgi:hypothetical protein